MSASWTYDVAARAMEDVVRLLATEFAEEVMSDVAREFRRALIDDLAASLANPATRIVVARESGGQPVGMARAEIRVDHPLLRLRGDARYGYIDAMYVRPGSRAQGCGRGMLANLEAWLKSSGVGVAVMHAETRRLTFYHTAGYSDHRERVKRL